MHQDTPSLGDIERLCRAYADEYDHLASKVQVLQDEIEAAKRKRLHGIKNAVAKAAAAKSALEAAVARAPHLFEKPKTLVICGVRVGYKKQPGRLAFDDPARVVALIRKHCPDQFETLVSVRETPLKGGLAQLSAAELKRLGVQLEADSEAVVVQSTADQVDKLVAALLSEADELEKTA